MTANHKLLKPNKMNTSATTTTETMDIFEFSRLLNTLNKEGRYQESLNTFKKYYHVFPEQVISGNGYLIAAVLNALRGTQHPERLHQGLAFLKRYHISILQDTSNQVLTSLAWLIYSHIREEMNEHNEDEAELPDELPHNNYPHYTTEEWEETALSLLPLLQQKDDKYCQNAFSFLFSAMIRYQKAQQQMNYFFLKRWCEAVLPDKLSMESKVVEFTINEQVKSRALVSDKERYYTTLSMVFFALQMHEACIKLSMEALSTIERFHFQGDVWMRRRLAHSLQNTGNDEQALEELRKVLERKDEWYIHMELAEILLKLGRVEEAARSGATAMLKRGDISFKVVQLYLLGLSLMQMQQHEQAAAHFQLSYLLRKQRGWGISEQLQAAIMSVRDFIPANTDADALRDQLLPLWRQLASVNHTPRPSSGEVEGTVNKILHQNERGTNGFIRYNKDKTIYFSITASDQLAQTIHKGMKVKFTESTTPDGMRTLAIKVRRS
jgi:tetratricopeptide (TPR) repeat protein